MNIQELLHKRVLVAEGVNNFRGKTAVEEFKILKISPSQKWVKIQNMNGNKFWKLTTDLQIIEVL